MTPEQKLAALFAAEAAPARDLLFETAVAERVARERAVRRVVAMTPWAAAAAAGLLGVQPAVGVLAESLGPSLTPATMILGAGLGAGLAAVWLVRRLSAV